MVKDATFTSVWDGGYEVTTNCKVDMETKEVFYIETAYVGEVEILERQFVTVDGVDYPVSDDVEETDFWYR